MDEFKGFTKSLTSPATRHFPIAPDDGADLPILPRVIYCEVAGTLMVRDGHGVDLSYTMGSGDQLAFRGTRILATGTTGTYYGWS